MAAPTGGLFPTPLAAEARHAIRQLKVHIKDAKNYEADVKSTNGRVARFRSREKK